MMPPLCTPTRHYPRGGLAVAGTGPVAVAVAGAVAGAVVVPESPVVVTPSVSRLWIFPSLNTRVCGYIALVCETQGFGVSCGVLRDLDPHRPGNASVTVMDGAMGRVVWPRAKGRHTGSDRSMRRQFLRYSPDSVHTHTTQGAELFVFRSLLAPSFGYWVTPMAKPDTVFFNISVFSGNGR
ncbi:hypothetical protein E2C01_008560 [Portunus trituberculatus]|uniref:Uncharacterized protein n=1 Tax=Portunus trituberculatus TaxID=210409 RepID=A0A5B7D4V0_PORTR|nr:hypothetical protein [Portunus trituberculatus]